MEGDAKRGGKGMLQRTAIAFAMIHDPEILILDEPMSGLDPLGRQMVVDIIRSCKQKETTVLFCSHILSDVERICDRIGVMNTSRLLTIITPDDLVKFSPPTEIPPSASPLEAFFLHTIATDNAASS